MEWREHMRTIQSELKRHGNKIEKEATICRKPSKSKMSRKEIEELMGVRRDTYIRRNGAIRKK